MITQLNRMIVEGPKANHITCKMRYCYTNPTERIQIIRIARPTDDFFERTVLPGVQIIFEAGAEAELEVHTYGVATAILEERISCDRLAAA